MTPDATPTAFVLALSTALVLAGLAGPAAAGSGGDGEPAIRPGSEIVEPRPCTLNWVFDDADGNVYLGTADHCVDGLGQAVRTAGSDEAFGTVAYTGGGFGGADDFALVEVDGEDEDRVDPATRGIQGPTGVYRPSPFGGVEVGEPSGPSGETPHPIPVLFHGHGEGWGEDEDTRTRGGTMTSAGEEAFAFVGPVTVGDSGGPVQTATGQAVGVVAGNAGTVAGVQPGTPGPVDQKVSGPLLVDSLADAEDAMGTELSLRTGTLSTVR